MGPWEAHLMGARGDDNGDPRKWPRSAHFLFEVERSSRKAASFYNEGKSQAAAKYLGSYGLLRLFMTPEVLHGTARIANPNDQLALRIVVALEVWLSSLAFWDTEARPDDTADEARYIEQLLAKKRKRMIQSPAGVV